LTADQIRNLTGVFEANGNIYFINPSSYQRSRTVLQTGYINPANTNALFNGQVFFNVPEGSYRQLSVARSSMVLAATMSTPRC
jgi:hypothetical protein